MKILVADDNRFYRGMLEATLVEWGYQVIVAGDGEEAWQLLQQKGGPALAIVDWMMPRLNGLELCRRVRAQTRAEPTYLILLTAKGGKNNIITGLQNGADDFISKPFDREELHARLQAGRRIVELQTNLAARVQELEHALSAAQKLEIMGRLAGGVAHDFNNLLTVIIGGCDLLLVTENDVQKRGMMDLVKKAGDRGATLTRQLLAFSRGQTLTPAILDINAVVSGAGNLLRRLVPEDITMQTHFHPVVGRIRADAGQIEQVLMNLVVNARDAMPCGGTLTIETAFTAIKEPLPGVPDRVPPGAYVVCRVMDTGCGMSDEIRSRIFEPFFTTKEVGKGTGLGLATVYGIVKQSDGFIQVDSQVDVGATFTIFLPVVTPVEATAVTPQRPQQPIGGRQTILLVEDEDPVRAIAHYILTNDHYTVLEARDGEEALRLSQYWPDPIHLLLTDVVMPKMNGRELADRIVQQRPALRVLFMSGYTAETITQHAVHQTGTPFLEKPFTPELLVGKVRETLDN